MSELKPWEKYQTTANDGPWAKYGSPEPKAAPQEAPQEDDDFWNRVYEQNVVIPVRASRNLMPYADTIHHKVIDPVIGAFTGEEPDDRQRKREEYDSYLRQKYPLLLESYETGADLVGSIYKPPMVQLTEPFVNQKATHPESVGINLQTGLSLAPAAVAGAIYSPKVVANSVGFIKARGPERASLRKYKADPNHYDEVERQAGGQPFETMVREGYDDLKLRETDIDTRLKAERQARDEAASRIADAKREISYQKKNQAEDINQSLAVGKEDADAAKVVVADLQKGYSKNAMKRNQHLEAQGATHERLPIQQQLYDEAYSTVDPQQKAMIIAAADHLETLAKQDAVFTGNPNVVTSKTLDGYRAFLQSNVDYGGHMTKKDRVLNKAANNVNNILDDAIEGNDVLRDAIKQKTIDYNTAMDLFGAGPNESNMTSLKTALRNPQTREMIDRVVRDNDIYSLDDARYNTSQQLKWEEAQRRGNVPRVPAEDELQAAEAAKQMAIKEYLRVKNEKLPLSSADYEAKLKAGMMSRDNNPRVAAGEKLKDYAENYYPGGPEKYYQKFNDTKVLRDVSGIDTAQGSRMTQVGRGVGGALGSAAGYLFGSTPASSAGWGAIGAGAGGLAGASLDFNASKVFRAGVRGDDYLNKSGVKRMVSAATNNSVKQLQERYGEQQTQMAMSSGVPIERLIGTKYEGPLMKTLMEDPKQAAIVHYVSMQKDPEYAAIVNSPEQKKKLIPTPQVPSLGEQLGSAIDNFSWAGRIGLDPQEKDESGFQYGEGVPQPASIKPFSFKKLFPSKSAVGSDIKPLPAVHGGELSTSEKVISRRAQLKGQSPEIADLYAGNSNAASPVKNGNTFDYGYARDPLSARHEHMHAQLMRANEVHPDAEKALDRYFMGRLKEYGVNPKIITDLMHGPKEFMPIVADLLEDSGRRGSYGLSTSGSHPFNEEQNRKTIQALRRFYTDMATEVQKMSKDDIKRIVGEYNKNYLGDIMRRLMGND